MLTAAATHAFPAPPKSRGEALAGLRSPSEAARAEAVNWIANRGAMADAPLLHERLRDDSETVREFAEQGLWLLWSRSGDAEIDRRMARGTDEMQAGRLADSVATFSEIIRRKPDFAEGWNRRATAYYLAGEYEKSIADCAEVLKRNPQHFGALSGLGQIYFTDRIINSPARRSPVLEAVLNGAHRSYVYLAPPSHPSTGRIGASLVAERQLLAETCRSRTASPDPTRSFAPIAALRKRSEPHTPTAFSAARRGF